MFCHNFLDSFLIPLLRPNKSISKTYFKQRLYLDSRPLWAGLSQNSSCLYTSNSCRPQVRHSSFFERETRGKKYYSSLSSPTSSQSFNASTLSIQEFHQISDETLHQLSDMLETLVESDHPKVEGWDIDYSSGVMNFSIGEHGTYVLNKQPPNKQIWLSSPFSGPKRFDYDGDQKCWFYGRDGSQLFALMRDEINKILGDDSFSKLLS